MVLISLFARAFIKKENCRAIPKKYGGTTHSIDLMGLLDYVWIFKPTHIKKMD